MKKMISMVTMLALTQTALAGSPKPEHCPSQEAILAAGLSTAHVEHDSGGWLFYKYYEKLGTTEKWGFAIGDIPAKTIDEAYTKAEKALESLRVVGEPEQRMGVWMCSYVSDEKYLAAAFTEPQSSDQSVNGLRRSLLNR